MESEFETRQQQQKKKQRLGMQLGIGFIIIFGAALIITNLTSNTAAEQLSAEIAKYNRSLPAEINSITRLDSITIPEKNKVQYHATLHVLKADIPADTLDSYNNYLNPTLVREVKHNAMFKRFRDLNIALKCTYRDENGEFLYEFTVTPDQYRE